jgi:hypothetical protein
MDLLKDKSYNQYGKLSRYNSFPYYYHKLDDKYVYGVTSQLNNKTPYVLHTVVKNDTYDSLALYYYNNPVYYWVICDFNRIRDPFEKPVVDTKLKIPVFSSIEFNNL